MDALLLESALMPAADADDVWPCLVMDRCHSGIETLAEDGIPLLNGDARPGMDPPGMDDMPNREPLAAGSLFSLSAVLPLTAVGVADGSGEGGALLVAALR